MIKKIITTCIGLIFGLALFAVGLLAIAILVTYPKLPSLETVQHYQPKMPLTIILQTAKSLGCMVRSDALSLKSMIFRKT